MEDAEADVEVGLRVDTAVDDDFPRVVEVETSDGPGIDTKAVFVPMRPDTCTSLESVVVAVLAILVSAAVAAAVEVGMVVPGI